jgi:hypothetical protein
LTDKYGDFFVEKLDGAIVITIADTCIVYHYRNSHFMFDKVPDLLLLDFSIGWDASCALAARVQ